MVGLVVATHGALADGFKDAAKMLAGDTAAFGAVGLVPGEEPTQFVEKLRAAIDEQDKGDGVIVLVDLFGGTPSNSVCQLLGRDDIYAIGGVSLPMVLEATFERSERSVSDLASHLVEIGMGSVFDIREHLAQNASSHDGEDEDFS